MMTPSSLMEDDDLEPTNPSIIKTDHELHVVDETTNRDPTNSSNSSGKRSGHS
jgi:hypothetical protein